MNDFKTNWTKEDLKIYTLIYCAKADFFEKNIEIEFIKSKVVESDFEKIHKEFEKDNDYVSVQKINQSVIDLGYTKDEKDTLFKEMKALFLTDGKYDIQEQNLLRGLNNILNL